MSELSDGAAEALRDALGAEHAAVWVYGLATAFAREPRVTSAVGDAMEQHRRLRDTAEQLIKDAGQTPPAAQPAYDVGQVDDQGSMLQALIRVENDCQVGWRSVLERGDDAELRRTALDGLTTSATRATRWRITAGQRPGAQQFPGQP